MCFTQCHNLSWVLGPVRNNFQLIALCRPLSPAPSLWEVVRSTLQSLSLALGNETFPIRIKPDGTVRNTHRVQTTEITVPCENGFNVKCDGW